MPGNLDFELIDVQCDDKRRRSQFCTIRGKPYAGNVGREFGRGLHSIG